MYARACRITILFTVASTLSLLEKAEAQVTERPKRDYFAYAARPGETVALLSQQPCTVPGLKAETLNERAKGHCSNLINSDCRFTKPPKTRWRAGETVDTRYRVRLDMCWAEVSADKNGEEWKLIEYCGKSPMSGTDELSCSLAAKHLFFRVEDFGQPNPRNATFK